MHYLSQVCCVGGGVIGAGWAARFALNGIDVTVVDPDPNAARKVQEVMANAERAYQRMVADARPTRGQIRFSDDLVTSVRDAEFIQESVPERLELKQPILAAIDAAASPNVIIASSTSGLLPSDMQANLTHAQRLVVGHPYNPVYLLPLVEVVAGNKTQQQFVAGASAIYESVGMKPITVRREIDAFIGDRLLEAMWREALWLVRDGVATVEEIDDVIRYSFGLRFAQMGMFQVYRIAGGEAGMRHFMAQFGPCLSWPWTRLTDVPELDDVLLDTITAQSDAQTGSLSIRDLERIRDDNLVDIMCALETRADTREWGAGELLSSYRKALASRKTLRET